MFTTITDSYMAKFSLVYQMTMKMSMEDDSPIVIPCLTRNPGPEMPIEPWILKQVQDDEKELKWFYRALTQQ